MGHIHPVHNCTPPAASGSSCTSHRRRSSGSLGRWWALPWRRALGCTVYTRTVHTPSTTKPAPSGVVNHSGGACVAAEGVASLARIPARSYNKFGNAPQHLRRQNGMSTLSKTQTFLVQVSRQRLYEMQKIKEQKWRREWEPRHSRREQSKGCPGVHVAKSRRQSRPSSCSCHRHRSL